ncbi:MAG: AMP-binding protein [Deltaproteobacteria bacterium]|nr:AMP-binding protein [Deltaproteobacteria bacterium]
MDMVEKLRDLSTWQVLEQSALAVPEKTAAIHGNEKTTYRELHSMAEALSYSIAGLGMGKGDRVAIYMPNSTELMASFFALQKLGLIVVWINPNYRKEDAQFILRDSGARGVVIFREWDGYNYLEGISSIRDSLQDLDFIFVVDGPEIAEAEIVSLHRMLEDGEGKSVPPVEIDNREDLSMLLYTSGTTGKPKGAMICHYAAVRGSWEYSRGFGATGDDIFIGFLPMCHSYGCGAVLIQPILLRSTVAIMEKFEPERAFQIIEREKVTLQPGAPAHYILELNHPKRKDYDLRSLRAGLIAGQIAPEGLIASVEKEMGVYLTSFWGASEVGPGLGIICPYPSPLDIREKYIGKPIAGTEVRIVDPDSHKELPDGEIGELTVSGWHVMKGYWKNPEETRKQIVAGWLHMGDLVSREEDGFLRIYGRTKDLINRGGFKIYPSELEALIVDHPKVKEVCMVATPNPVLGENICACIIPVEGEIISLAELRDFLKDKIAPHKLPDELCLMEDFPRLSGGVKINKFGKGGLAELAAKDERRERYRK